MNAGPEHDRWADAAGAYLLAAMPEHERAAFEEHLAVCGVCRDDVDELRVASDALPGSAPQVEPPPELRDRIMSIVRREAELLAAAGPEADRAPAPPAPKRGWMTGWLRRPSFAVPVMAGLLAAAVFAGALAGGAFRDDTKVKTISAQVFAGDKTADARLELHRDSTRLVAEHLPAPPPGRVYQVWLKRDGVKDPQPTNALFRVRGDGEASVDVPGNMKGVQQVLVTDEPDGGSEKPTGEVAIAAAVPA